MPELKELLEAVHQNNEALAEIESDLTDLRVEIGNLPDKYLPRDEAKEKSERVKLIAKIAGAVGIILILLAALFTYYVSSEGIAACRDDRSALREVINIAVADRRPLPSSGPEIAAAIEETNRTQVRPLRERLLSLEGTQPEKC